MTSLRTSLLARMEWLVTATRDSTAHLWNIQNPITDPIVLSGHDDTSSVAFSPDGKWLAIGSWGKTVRLWDMQNPAGEPLVLRGHDDWVRALAFSPDGGGWRRVVKTEPPACGICKTQQGRPLSCVGMMM